MSRRSHVSRFAPLSAVASILAFVHAAPAGESAPCPFTTEVAGGPVYCGPFRPWSQPQPQGLSDSGIYWAGYRNQCGDNDTYETAILWTPQGGIQDLPVPAGTVESRANAVNDFGTAVGLANTTIGGTVPAHWAAIIWAGGTFMEIPPVPPATGFTWAADINNAGWVVGEATAPQGSVTRSPFVWHNGELTLIDPAQFGKTTGIARCISDSGFVVGSFGNQAGSSGRAFRWKDGAAEILQPLPGAINSVAFGVNNHGVAVGQCRFAASGSNPVSIIPTLWDVDGTAHALSLYPDYSMAGGTGISDEGLVMGEADAPSQSGSPSYVKLVWMNGTPYSIEELAQFRVVIGDALDMNRSGQVVGYGAVASDQDATVWIVTPTWSAADLNGDCTVDGADLQVLLASWGSVESGSPVDLDGDGKVDGADLGMLLGRWTASR